MIYGFNDKKEKIDLLDIFYPVGSIYETSSDSFNPGTRWGGTWVKVQDKVLVGAGSIFPSGQIGGHKTTTYTPVGTVGDHTLTVSEIPSHTHAATLSLDTVSFIGADSGTELTAAAPASSQNTGGQGGGQAHSHTFTGTQATLDNMPPYEVINIWKRIA